MRISDWSSDVCSSDLYVERGDAEALRSGEGLPEQPALLRGPRLHCHATEREDRSGPVGEGAGYRVLPAAGLLCEGVGREPHDEIGRASCRERVCQYV